jgi:hypothetical protein
MVREIRFQKSGLRNLVKSGSTNSDVFSASRKVVDQKNRWVYTINPPFSRLEKSGPLNSDFFLVREKWLTRKKNEFAEPLFYTFLQIKWSRGSPHFVISEFVIPIIS